MSSAIDRPKPPGVAKDLPSLQSGQRVLVARDGKVVSPRANRQRVALNLTIVGAGSVALVVLNPLIGAAVVVGIGIGTWRTLGRTRQIRTALRLALDGKLDEAERVVDGIRVPLIGGDRRRANLASIRSTIAERRGDLEAALRHADDCARFLRAPRRGFAIVYWQNQFNRAHWLLELGRHDDAKAQIARAGRAPIGEWYRMQYRFLSLHAAFAGVMPLPDDAKLHDWLSDSLRYNHTGMHLALLAWAFEQRGDADTAAHAMNEAPSRLLAAIDVLERVFPRLWAWVGPRLAAAEAAADAAAVEET